MAALDLGDAEVPEWVHLLPTTRGQVQTADSRGPYDVTDPQAIIAASFAGQTKIQVDENHAEDLKSGKGEPSPARGWITELQARADGIWGRVEWTGAGRALVADKAYRAMSPVILHDASKRITSILRASLVNRPNLRGLATLNSQENSMGPMAKVAAALGLPEGASEDDIVAAIKALSDKKPEADVAMQSALKDIGVALGIEGDAKPEALVVAAKLAVSGKGDLVAMQSQLAAVTAQLAATNETKKREAAISFYDKALSERRQGVNGENRERLIALHMTDAATAEGIVSAMPMLTAHGALTTPPPAKDGVTSLNAEQLATCAALGISEEDFKKTVAAEQKERS